MKKLLTITLLFTFSIVNAQEFKYGLKGGINLTGFHTQNGTVSDLMGYNFGGVVKMNLSSTFDLQGEILLNRKGGIYRYSNIAIENPEVKLTYLNIPILFKINITDKFNFHAGPEMGILLAKKATLSGEELEVNIESNLDINALGGLEYQFQNGIFIQTRYSYGLTKLFENKDYKNSAISLSVGYFLN